MFRKLSLGLVLALSAWAFAAPSLTLDDVNSAIKELLRDFNNSTTRTEVKFTVLEIADGLTQNFGMNGRYSKTGKENTLVLSLPQVRYVYQEQNGRPALDALAILQLDLVKAYTQKWLNEVAVESADMVKEFLSDMTKQYGEAITLDAAIDQLDRDSNGDLTQLKLHLSGAIDLTKLPKNLPAENELIIAGRGDLEVTRESASLKVHLDFNKDYKGYRRDQQGLKEFIEGLLAGNRESYAEVTQYVSWLNQFAKEIVDRPARK